MGGEDHGPLATAPLDPPVAFSLHELAQAWEPGLYGALGSSGPAQFIAGLKSPCLERGGSRRCVPGVYLMGNWQSGMTCLAAALREHPGLKAVGGGGLAGACFGHWKDDGGGRRWLLGLDGTKRPADFDPSLHVLAALDCVSMMAYYPSFAGRFHRYWEARGLRGRVTLHPDYSPLSAPNSPPIATTLHLHPSPPAGGLLAVQGPVRCGPLLRA